MRHPIARRRPAAILSLIAALAPGLAAADYVRVEENIANPHYPTHYVAISPQPGGRRVGNLTLRCENNRTEAFLSVDGVFGYNGTLSARWKGMAAAQRIAATDSTTGQAAFIQGPIPFIVRLVEEGGVILAVEGYTARGAGEYRLNDLRSIDGIYALAETCEWADQLPPRAAPATATPGRTATTAAMPAATPEPPGTDRVPMSETRLRLFLRDLRPEVERYGLDRVIEILRETMVNEN